MASRVQALALALVACVLLACSVRPCAGYRLLEDASGSRVEIDLSRRSPGRGKQSSRRQLDDAGFVELAPIYRENDGVYFTKVKIGTEVFELIADTGSSTIAVACSSCSTASCGKHARYDASTSAHSTPLSSSYSQCYSEGSCNRGKYVRDRMCFVAGDDAGGAGAACMHQAVEHKFGCCTAYAPAFRRQESDGIIGISGASDTLIADLRNHHKLQTDLFALCLSGKVGILAVGGFDASRHLEPTQWVPMQVSGGFYKVVVDGIFVDGQHLALGRLPTPIVDSGTTFTYVPASTHDVLRKVFDTFCARPGMCPGTKNPKSALAADLRDAVVCYEPPADVIAASDLDPWLEKFPSLELQFAAYEGKAARVCVPPGTYFFRSQHNAFCVGLLRERSRFVLGAITMSGMDHIFDHENGRLGLARAVCDRSRDGEPGTRTSPAECCGSCMAAQRAGFNPLPAKVRDEMSQTPAPAPAPAAPPVEVEAPTEATVAPAVDVTPVQAPAASPASPAPAAASTPTPAPSSTIDLAPTPAHSKVTTPDGNFYISLNAHDFPNRTVLFPVAGRPWTKSTLKFEQRHVLLIDNSASLCASVAEAHMTFHADALVVVDGADAAVHLGVHCAYGGFLVKRGASLRTLLQAAEKKQNKNGEKLRNEGEGEGEGGGGAKGAKAAKAVEVHGRIRVGVGSVRVEGGTTLAFARETAGMDLQRTSSLEVMSGGAVACAFPGKEAALELLRGVVDFHPGASCSCYTLIGDHAVLGLRPSAHGEADAGTQEGEGVFADTDTDVSSSAVVTFSAPLEVRGTVQVTMLRDPFRSFVMVARGGIIYSEDDGSSPRLQVLLGGEGDELVRDVPRRARLFAAPLRRVQDRPERVEWAPPLQCAGAALDATATVVVLPAELCINHCLEVDDSGSSSKKVCSEEERTSAAWPPDADDKSLAQGAGAWNLTAYKDWLDKVGLPSDDPATQKSVKSGLGGALLGVLAGVLVFCVVYPAAALRRLCCCCSGRGSGAADARGYGGGGYDGV